MNISELTKAIWDIRRATVGHDVGSECKPGEDPKKCKKNKRNRSVFPVLYPGHMGTPHTYDQGSANDSLQTGGATGPVVSSDISRVGGTGGGGDYLGETEGNAVKCRPSRIRVLHEMRKSLGLLEYGDATNPDPSWGGFSVPNMAMTKIRGGGPQITGPGFPGSDRDGGGKYDYRKSPGLALRTELGWRIWKAALDIIDRHKAASKPQIMMMAMQKAGVHRGQIDPAELRLIEMGVEWYLTSQGSLAARRGAGAPIDSGGILSGPGAP